MRVNNLCNHHTVGMYIYTPLYMYIVYTLTDLLHGVAWLYI